MSEILETLASLAVLVFVISSMFSMGLSLTMGQIAEPLKNTRLVILALAANFVLVPTLAYLITIVFPLEQPLTIGLILLSTAAGAPFLPKLAQVAKGNVAFSVGLMVLLMVVTIIYLPLVLPLLLGDVEVNPWEIARSLIVMMLIPLAIGLFIRARYEETAAGIQPTFGMAANIAILAGILFVVISLVIGYLLGIGSDNGIKSVMGLGAAQRNISAALVVAGQNFDSDVVTYLIVMAVISLIILMPVAGELGKRLHESSEGEEESVAAT